MFKKTILAKGLVIAFGSGAALWCSAALAQDQAPAGQDVQRVLVTGSNIRRTDAEQPNPVQVISAQDMKQSGYTSVSEVLNNLTANGQGALSQGFSGAFASGASGVSLRGLTTAATLVLIDGHRSAPYPIGDDGQRSFVDVSNIPFDAVERIEVLKDGASAIYGSDAIAGVVNIILKRNYTGASITADLGQSWKRDGATRHVAGIFGVGDLSKDGYNFYVSGEFRGEDQIKYENRRGVLSKTDYTDWGGINTTLGVPTPQNHNFARSTTGYVTSLDGSAITGFMPGCNATSYAAGDCAYKDSWSQIQPNTKNANLVTRFTKNLSDDWQVSAQVTYFESKAQQVGAPSRTLTAGGVQGITSGPGVTPTLQTPFAPTTISSTNPTFPTTTDGSTTGILRYVFLNDLGPTVTNTDAKTNRAVIDLSGTAFGWDTQLSGGVTSVTLAIDGTGYINLNNLQTALDSTTDPFLVGQKNSASVLSFIAPTLTTNDSSSLNFFHAGASRDLFKLPGGELSLALGYDWTDRKQHATAPAGIEAGQYQSVFSNNFTIGEQTVNSVYAELSAPVLKSLETDLAVRYDHYNLSGGKASPKFGFKWTPVDMFALRGTASKGFRAPGPAENGTAGQTFFAGTTTDPILCGNAPGANQTLATTPGNFPVACDAQLGTVQSTNKALHPETSKSFTLGIVLEPIKNISATLDWYSIEIDNQIVPGGPQTQVRGTSLAPIAQVQPDGSLKNVAPPVAPIAYLTTSYINANSTKTAGVEGDISAKMHLGAAGDFKTDLDVSYMYKYDLTTLDPEGDGVSFKTFHLAGQHGPFIIGGDTGNPRVRAKWTNTLTSGNFDWTVTGNYMSGMSLVDQSAGIDDCLTALQNGAGSAIFSPDLDSGNIPKAASRCKVGAFITFDTQASWRFNKNFTINASVVNLFNKQAPVDWQTYGGGTTPYNSSLDQLGAIGRYYTIGGTYTF